MTWWAWAILGIALIAADIHFTHDFTLFCGGVAALMLSILSELLPMPLWWQWAIFAALAPAVLLTVRGPLLGRFQPHRGLDADYDYLVGEVATPDADVDANGVGRAELRGSIWTAHNGDTRPLSKGQRCRVTRVEGLTLWLKAD